MPASPFVWYELMTTDLKGAEAFYKAVLGWNTDPMPGDMPYILGQVGKAGVAGMMNIPPHAKEMNVPPHWAGYIYSADVDGQTASVKAAGGNVYREPENIPNVGRFSVVTDPQGASFMLFSPEGNSDDREQAPEGMQGTVGWRELYTKDWEKAADFYSSQFGWVKDQAVEMGEFGTYQTFTADGAPIVGMMNLMPGMPQPFWGYYFNVDGLDAAIERVTAGGGQITNGPMEVPGGQWIVNCIDPQGAHFSLVANAR
jgi:predicted enzyme related to lactoylglutathione lyase